MELTIKAADENLEKINDFIHSLISDKCSGLILNQIDLAVEEIFVNIAHYSGAETATISCECKGENLEIIFTDTGLPFNPLEKADPDITLKAEDRQIGGLGIFLTKKFMDSVVYEYRDGKNILKLNKMLTQR